MQAVIMAGGLGTRLRELTHDEIPKPMIEICGKPLLQWQIEKLKTNGFNDIIVVVGRLSDLIIDKFGDTVKYYKEDKPLGTAGALLEIKDLLKNDFFLIYGDLFFDIDFARMMQFHRDKYADATLFVHPNSHPYDSDLVVLNRSERVEIILSKHDNRRNQWLHNCTNAGIYILNKTVLNYFPRGITPLDLDKQILPKIHYLYGYKSSEYVKDIGTVERYYQVRKDIICGIPEKRNLKNKQRAIFLDRDGTLNEFVGLVSHPAQLILFPYTAEAIRKINQSGYLAIVVTNQPAVARGLCSLKDIDYIHARLEETLGAKNAYLDDIFFCPHHPDKGYPEENPFFKIDCDCRKPKPGMLLAAAKKYNIDLSQSWMIGDSDIDVEAGINAGTRAIRTYNLLETINEILEEEHGYTT